MTQGLGKSSRRGVLGVVVALTVPLLSSRPADAFFHAEPDIEGGRALYMARCASCHGANLQGQPDWQSTRADGSFPAPPHDATGHTWHHGDAMLTVYIRRGGQAVLDDMGVDVMSGMPPFGDRMTDAEIEAVLAFIKSTWPEAERAVQEERTAAEAAGE